MDDEDPLNFLDDMGNVCGSNFNTEMEEPDPTWCWTIPEIGENRNDITETGNTGGTNLNPNTTVETAPEPAPEYKPIEWWLNDTEAQPSPPKKFKPDFDSKTMLVFGPDGEVEFTAREEISLVEKQCGIYRPLPDGWTTAYHQSGMPMYIHKESRVYTFSRPYVLNNEGDSITHSVPLSAIPCLAYKTALEQENMKPLSVFIDDSDSVPQGSAINGGVDPNDRLLKVCPLGVNDYCSNLFTFKKYEVLDIPKPDKKLPLLELAPCLHGKVKLTERWLNEINGQSYTSIIRSVLKHPFRAMTSWKHFSLEGNVLFPYKSNFFFNGVKYGTGFGKTKKWAKCAALKEALSSFIPSMDTMYEEDNVVPGRVRSKRDVIDLQLLDGVSISDTRVPELSRQVGVQSPYYFLLACLRHKFYVSESAVTISCIKIDGQRWLTLSVGSITETSECRSKRDGKDRIAQKLIHMLNPKLSEWPEVIGLYSCGLIAGQGPIINPQLQPDDSHTTETQTEDTNSHSKKRSADKNEAKGSPNILFIDSQYHPPPLDASILHSNFKIPGCSEDQESQLTDTNI